MSDTKNSDLSAVALADAVAACQLYLVDPNEADDDDKSKNITLSVLKSALSAISEIHYAEMNYYEAASTITVTINDEYIGIQGEFTVGANISSDWTVVAGKSGATKAITTAQGGTSINIAHVAHTLSTGDIVNVQSANHNGTGTVLINGVDNFEVDIAYVGDENGDWQEGDHLLAGAGSDGLYRVHGNATSTSVAAGLKNFKYELCQNENHLDNSAFELTTNSSVHMSGAAETIIDVTAGDRIWMQFKNETDTEDAVLAHAGIVLTKL